MAVGAALSLIGTAAGSNNNSATYGLGGSQLRSSGSQLAGVIPYNNLPTDRKATTNDYGYAIARSIFDPSGIFMKGKKKKGKTIPLPVWEESPYYASSMADMASLYSQLISGDLPDFYSSLGQSNSPEYQAMMGVVNKNTQKAVEENLVRRGISRGGIGGSSIAQAMADVGAQYGYQDYLQSQSEKAGLLSLGTNLMNTVNSSAINWTQMKNAFNLDTTKLALGMDSQAFAQAAANSQANSQGVGSMIGAIGSLIGLFGGSGSSGSNSSGSLSELSNFDTSLADSAAKSYSGSSYSDWASQYFNMNRGAA